MLRLKYRLALLHAFTQLGLALIAFGLVAIGLHALGISLIQAAIIVPALTLGFGFSMVCSIVLWFVNCPVCGKRYIGNTSAGDHHPRPKLFTPICRHCHHDPQ
jgi:hypothetical protein